MRANHLLAIAGLAVGFAAGPAVAQTNPNGVAGDLSRVPQTSDEPGARQMNAGQMHDQMGDHRNDQRGGGDHHMMGDMGDNRGEQGDRRDNRRDRGWSHDRNCRMVWHHHHRVRRCD